MARHDPAAPPRLSLATLQQNSVIQPQIADWLDPGRDGEGDFHQRFAQHYSLPGNPASVSYCQYPRSLTSSMARAQIHQPSNASAYTPSLYSYAQSDVTPTESSVSTALASQLSGVPLLEDVDGVLQRPTNQTRQPVFECTFWFLSCSYVSRDIEEWSTHCLSHFRGEEPPKSVTCPLCGDFNYNCNDGWASWRFRTQHLASHHLQGHTLRTSRPDFHLFQHLWQKRLIDDADLKELKGGNHNLSHPPSNYTMTEGRRERERRRHRPRTQHVGAHPRR